MVVLLYRPNLIFVLLISMASNIDNPLYYAMLCALAAYCLRRAAIMKGSPCDLSATTITSCSLRLSTKASEVGVRIRFIRQPIPDEVKARPPKRLNTFSLAFGFGLFSGLLVERSGGGAPRAVTCRTYMSGTWIIFSPSCFRNSSGVITIKYLSACKIRLVSTIMAHRLPRPTKSKKPRNNVVMRAAMIPYWKLWGMTQYAMI